ncbi:hypothetical protein FRB96_003096 [Tulasnella sp. 330]|nr:hypothetical protein FRB96_003096 [Tulasnella sp. 330]KAG8878311.1 hypothetical protein FRB97_002607 [Tulasnella sp. 331]
MSRIVVTAFHAAALAYMVWAFNSLQGIMKGIEKQRGGQFQFLTIQGLVLAEATLATCLLCDFMPTVQRYARVRRILILVAMPLALVVSIIYWALIIFMPTLIMQQGSSEPTSDPIGNAPNTGNVFGPDFRIPLPADLALHLSPVVTLATHFFVTEVKYDPQVEWCAAKNGNFSYPFLNVPFPGRLAIYLGSTVMATGGFRLLNGLHRGEPIMPSMYGASNEK